MKLAIVGFGQAGGKILDEFVAYNSKIDRNIISDAVAINTARSDLRGLENVPEDRKLLIGQSSQRGDGVGADNVEGAEVTSDEIDRIDEMVARGARHSIDGFLIIAGLGGGTGSGGSPILAKHLKETHDNIPVYVLGVLPSSSEGSLYTLNAARSVQTFLGGDADWETTHLLGEEDLEIDSLILVDNDAFKKEHESIQDAWERINHKIARDFTLLFSAGEPPESGDVPESVIDTAEIEKTLARGKISTVGYASTDILKENYGLLDMLRPGKTERKSQSEIEMLIPDTVRDATYNGLSVDVNIDSSLSALALIAGPSDSMSRNGVETARQWIEDVADTHEVRGGDYPINEDKLASVVLFSGIHDSNRLRELQREAINSKRKIEQVRQQSLDPEDVLLEGQNRAGSEQSESLLDD